MREVIFKCDKCGKVADRPIRIEAWYMDKTANVTTKAYVFIAGEKKNEVDLCEDCAKALNEFIYPVDPEEEEDLEDFEEEEDIEDEPEEEPEEEPFIPKKFTARLKKDLLKKPKKTYDIGKIKALRDAGWTLKKIAEEMGGCSPQTIANKLKEAGS